MSYSAVRSDGVALYPAMTSSTEDRLSFLRKVYGLTFLGVLVFALSAALPLAGLALAIPGLQQIGELALGIHPLISFGVLVASSFVVHMVSMRKYLNVIALFLFAALWGFITIPLLAYAVAVTGGVGVIFQALGLTTIVFGGLTAYVFITKKDFSFLGGFLMVGLFLLFGVIIISLVASLLGYGKPSALSYALSIFAVILFSGYVLYDTSNILHHYATDMVVPAALALMVDFIILFRNILYLLVSSRD